MKNAIILVAIIITGILVIVLTLNQTPEILDYDMNGSNYVTQPPAPEINLHVVTSEPDFWSQVKAMNEKNKSSSIEHNDAFDINGTVYPEENPSEDEEADAEDIPEDADVTGIPEDADAPEVTTTNGKKLHNSVIK